MSTTTAIEKAAAFFHKHAAWSYHPATETRRQGRERCARELAEAEAWAQRNLIFDWEHDPDYDGDDGPAFGCMVRRMGESEVLASLWAITFARLPFHSDPYRRVVEAELADEVLSAQRANVALLEESPELRALVAYTA